MQRQPQRIQHFSFVVLGDLCLLYSFLPTVYRHVCNLWQVIMIEANPSCCGLLVTFGTVYYFYGDTQHQGTAASHQFFLGDLTPLKRPRSMVQYPLRVVVNCCHPLEPFCLRGPLATGDNCCETQYQDVCVFVIWEPVLPTDLVAPFHRCARSHPDARAAQYWDRKRACLTSRRNRIVNRSMDTSRYMRGERYVQDAPPKPIYSDNPVRDVISVSEGSSSVAGSGNTPTGGEVMMITSQFIPAWGMFSTSEKSIFAKGRSSREDIAQDSGALAD